VRAGRNRAEEAADGRAAGAVGAAARTRRAAGRTGPRWARAAGTSRPARVLRLGGGRALRIEPRAALAGAGLLLAALAGSVALIGTGDYRIAPLDVLRTLAGHGTAGQEFVVRELRLPRVLVALPAGAALGTAGAAFQTVTRNPLGSPDVIGFGQGSATGALVVIVLLKGPAYEVAAGAVAGGLLTGFAVYLLAWQRGVNG
jgi:iron complex transport system permease protein